MLKAKDISYQYKNFPILDRINVSVQNGEFIAIVGPNGAGKSSLLNLLANELSKDHSILFKDKTFKEWNIKELAHHKAKFSQQNNHDIPLIVKDVVLMGRYPYFNAAPHESDLEAVENAMKETDVLHFKDRDYVTLSGGEKQRVHLARVLAQLENENRHKLIFLDEPLNNLDIKHQHTVLDSIRKFTQKGNSALVVLHDLNITANYADRVLMMKNGKIEAEGTPDEVLTSEIVSNVYNFPCMVYPNPKTNKTMIVFG